MVNALIRLIIAAIALSLCAGLLGCASSPEASQNRAVTTDRAQDRVSICDEDCIQPPLLKAELLPHLMLHQARILSREDYKKKIPPLVRDVAYGPKPDGPLRDGEPLFDHDQTPYDGALNWHLIEYDEVVTEGVEDRAFRNREVSGAHCFFARQPNRHTSIFALLVVHHPDRGDLLYIGGPDHNENRLDTVPLTDHHKSPLRVHREHIYCAFRDDQNDVGALIVPFEYEDVEAPSNGPHFAVFHIVTSTQKRPTGKTQTIERSRTRGGHAEKVQVPVLKYGDPVVELLGSYTSLYDAVAAAEESIPKGRFRLRRDFIYPRMPYLSYLDGKAEEFCPVHTECRTPPANLDVDVRATFAPEEREELEEEAEDAEDGEAHEELQEVSD